MHLCPQPPGLFSVETPLRWSQPRGAEAQACPTAIPPTPPGGQVESLCSEEQTQEGEQRQRDTGLGRVRDDRALGGNLWLGPGSSARVQIPPVLHTLQCCGVSGLTSWVSRARPPQGAPRSLEVTAPSSLEGPSVQPPVLPRSGSPGGWGPESKERGQLTTSRTSPGQEWGSTGAPALGVRVLCGRWSVSVLPPRGASTPGGSLRRVGARPLPARRMPGAAALVCSKFAQRK